MVAILNITKGKNKVIVSVLAGALSALIFLTAIHIAAKIAIIVSAAAVTYLLLLLIHKIRTKKEQPAEITGVQEVKDIAVVDEGEEKDTEVSAKEPERTETELEEEIIRKRAEEKMKNGLPEHMDLDGNSLAGADDTSQTKYATNYMDLMRSPPMPMNGCYQEITEVASAPKTFVTSDSMRMPERLTMKDIVNQRG